MIRGLSHGLRTGCFSKSALCASPLGARFASGEVQDVVVIGGGPGGYVAAIKAGQLGMKVTCVEKRGALGGTCLNVGCIPSKSLLNSSHMLEEATESFPAHGIKVSGVEVDLGTMMKLKDTTVKGLTGGIEGLFKKNKVTYAKGFGSVRSPTSVEVKAEDGSVETIETKNIILATGSDAVELPFLPYDEQKVVSSTGALSLSSVPRKMAVIGGGVIGLEMASVWRRLGAEVEVIEFLDTIGGPGMDGQIAKEFFKILKKQGLAFRMGTKVTGADIKADGVTLSIEAAKGGKADTIDADVVLVAVGRRPYTDGLGLDAVGLQTNDRGMVISDDHFRVLDKNGSPSSSVYAIGDCREGPMLAHKAEEEGIACVEAIHSGSGHINYDAIPGVIYTHPEVAFVGKSEEDCKDQGIAYRVGTFPFLANSRARANGEAQGLVKFISDAETDRVLGVHILGANAGEMIHEPCLLISYEGSSEDLARSPHAHPTLSEAIKEAAMAAYDKPIHF